MTDAELIVWAARQCDWEVSEDKIVSDGHRLSPCYIVLRTLEGPCPIEQAGHVDALALQLWRRWSVKEIFTSHGTVSELRGRLEPMTALILQDSLACIRAIYESEVME